MGSISLRNVTKSFGTVTIIPDISLEIDSGEFVVFVGPSGCGKSTLLRLIAGLENATAGEMEIAGQRVDHLPPAKRGISMVFQSYALYPHMTARGNIAFGLEIAGLPKPERNAKVEQAAATLDLTEYLDRKPAQLSGGQRQRVAIGRAIVRDPKVFLFDEPLSNLDAALRVQMRLEISRLHHAIDATMVYVTHDQTEAMTMADRIVVLNGGRIEQIGTPSELYNNPANVFVAAFIGSPKMNFIDGEVAARYDATQIGIRPEHIEICEEPTDWKGTVLLSENLGSDTFFYTETPVGPLVVRSVGEHPFKSGETVHLRPLENRIHRFDKTGASLTKAARKDL